VFGSQLIYRNLQDERFLVKMLRKFVSWVVWVVTIERPHSLWHPLKLRVFGVSTERQHCVRDAQILYSGFITWFVSMGQEKAIQWQTTTQEAQGPVPTRV
jgi:hypothetical protein